MALDCNKRTKTFYLQLFGCEKMLFRAVGVLGLDTEILRDLRSSVRLCKMSLAWPSAT